MSSRTTARPTVGVPTMAQARGYDDDDGLTCRSAEDVLWTRCNTAEAVPGVIKPMTWSMFTFPVEIGLREGCHDLGLIPGAARGFPAATADRFLASFYGRFAVNVTSHRAVYGLIPGLTADDVEHDLLGSLRAGDAEESGHNRLAAMLTRIPFVVATWRNEPARHLAETRRFWRASVGPQGLRPGLSAEEIVMECVRRSMVMPRYQVKMRLLLQTVTAQLRELAQRAGVPDAVSTLLAGASGTEESIFAEDLYRTARGEHPLAEFLADHGYQGPNSGLPDARSWREDAGALERMLPALAKSEAPSARRARAGAERARVATALVAGLPARSRPRARALIGLVPVAARGLQMMKTSKLLAVDVSRAAARALGADLAAAGRLDDAEDVFFLFADELRSARARDLREVVAPRRERHGVFLETELAETWRGMPVPVVTAAAAGADGGPRVLSGVGASTGVVEGRVRIVLDPAADVEVEPGDVLVCPTTDPSWVSLMMLASAIVIDIGAAVSHGAIIARELGLPCVIGTGRGTRVLRDGDLVRVDGTSGTVETLDQSERTASAAG